MSEAEPAAAPKRSRWFTPDTLFARIAIVLVLNLVLVQAMAFVLIGLEVNRQLYDDPEVASRVASVVQSLNAVPQDQRENLAHALSEPGFAVHVMMPGGRPPGPPDRGPGSDHGPGPNPPPDHGPDGNPPPGGDRAPPPPPDQWHGPPFGGPPPEPPPDSEAPPDGGGSLQQRLASQFEAQGSPAPEIRVFQDMPGPPIGGETPRWSRVIVGLKDGGAAAFAIHRRPPPFSWYPVLLMVATVCIVVSAMSLMFARSFSRHLAGFASAAEAFGRSADAPPMPESGPREIRLATGAFNRMQARLRRFIRDRTQMLAAISHDLRTPLTRMRLRAEFVEDEELREKLLLDVGEMEAMIRETLAFARDDFTAEPRQPEDLDLLLDDFATAMREGGQDVSYDSTGPALLTCSPTAIRRAIGNLLENAVKYGNRARVTLRRTQGHLEIVVDDDGPGIPGAMHEQVFQPFFRLEGSRNRDTGGVGLGLAVTRNIVRGHGGDVTIANRPEGGLRVTMTLPA